MTPLSSESPAQSDLNSNQFAVAPNRQLFGKVMTGLVFTCVAIAIIPLASILYMVIAMDSAAFRQQSLPNCRQRQG